MNKIEQIKAELKRLKNDWASLDDELTDTMVAEYDYLLDFLSTLESEKPMQEGFEEEMDKYVEQNGLVNCSEIVPIARHFAQWGAEHLHPEKMLGGVFSSYDMAKAYVEGQNNILTNLDKYNLMRKPKSPLPDLEEAADNHIRNVVDTAGHPGWDWTTQDIADAFIAGAKWQKEQMMKEAVEKDVHELYTDEEGYHCYVSLGTDYMPGDKVRIIIVKEDGE